MSNHHLEDVIGKVTEYTNNYTDGLYVSDFYVTLWFRLVSHILSFSIGRGERENYEDRQEERGLKLSL